MHTKFEGSQVQTVPDCPEINVNIVNQSMMRAYRIAIKKITDSNS